jgi:hypothetical protein
VTPFARRASELACVGVCAFTLAACDVAPFRATTGPHVVSSTPADGASEVDRRAVLRIELDRRIAPASASTASVRLISGGRAISLSLDVDVVRPGIVVTPHTTLDPEVTYVLVIDPLRDLDGRRGSETVSISFHTGIAEDGTTPPPSVPFDDVLPIFTERCATATCHGGGAPILGLDLSSAESVRRTAIGIGAQEVRRPVDGASTYASPSLSGQSIVEAGNAARSYLVYKLLGEPHAAGAPMPPPTGEGGEGALSPGEIDRIVSWIREGALLPGPS